MFKRILVPLDTSNFTTAATRTAAALAAGGSEGGPATLTGLGVVDLDQLPTGRFAALVPRDKILADAQQTVHGLLEDFRAIAREQGLPDNLVETREVAGSPFREIIRESVFNDLIVMGEQCSFPPVNHDYETLHSLYHEASRPLLITRRDYSQVDTVLLMMDGTAPASRMLYTYVHLRPFPAARVVLVHSRAEEARYELGDYFTRVAGFLGDYGLRVTSHPIAGELEDEISAVVREESAQVLALGIHPSHFLDRVRDPLNLRPPIARRLLADTPASLFLVH